MEQRTAEVLFKDVAAGELAETATGGSRFTYAPGWNTPIACCLPVERREHEWARGLHPFFQHLGPEGWLREQQARVAHVDQEDDLGLLLRYGSDCIGAVSIRSTDPSHAAAPVAEATANPGRTVSGVQRKLLVVKGRSTFEPAGPEGSAPYIAKFNSERLPTLVRNESLSLRWTAAVLGEDEVTKFALGHVNGINEPALIVTRFDRTEDGRKLRLEDFAQILCKPRGPDYAGKYDAGHEDLAKVVESYSTRPAIDLDRLFRRLIVFALVGNTDAHLKNYSLVETDAGLRLSPIYDVVNAALYAANGFEQIFGLTFDGKRYQLSAVDRQLLVQYARSIGLPERAIVQAFLDLKSRVTRKRVASLLTPPAGEPPDGFVHRFAEIVRGACLRILGE